jgi:hypothetical protein
LRALDEQGWCRLPGILDARQCGQLIELYRDDSRFRKTISMDHHRYGSGEYRYFSYPLPRLVAGLRGRFYRRLVPLANEWMRRLGRDAHYPDTLAEYLGVCHAAGQQRPTPLLLRYSKGGYNRLHQDRYGERSFPFQVVIPLSRKGADYQGGEFVFTEHVARMQSRVTVHAPERGDAVVFPNAERPVEGARGYRRAMIKHGAGTITRGERYALGLIFHDSD